MRACCSGSHLAGECEPCVLTEADEAAWDLWRLVQWCSHPDDKLGRVLSIEAMTFAFANPDVFGIDDPRQRFDDLHWSLKVLRGEADDNTVEGSDRLVTLPSVFQPAPEVVEKQDG